MSALVATVVALIVSSNVGSYAQERFQDDQLLLRNGLTVGYQMTGTRPARVNTLNITDSDRMVGTAFVRKLITNTSDYARYKQSAGPIIDSASINFGLINSAQNILFNCLIGENGRPPKVAGSNPLDDFTESYIWISASSGLYNIEAEPYITGGQPAGVFDREEQFHAGPKPAPREIAIDCHVEGEPRTFGGGKELTVGRIGCDRSPGGRFGGLDRTGHVFSLSQSGVGGCFCGVRRGFGRLIRTDQIANLNGGDDDKGSGENRQNQRVIGNSIIGRLGWRYVLSILGGMILGLVIIAALDIFAPLEKTNRDQDTDRSGGKG